MSPRRSKYESALEDLRLLPRVLRALEVLNAEQEKVRALMGKTTFADVRPYIPLAGDEVLRQGAERIRQETARGLAMTDHPDMPETARQALGAILNTPERQEYEAAKRAGTLVKDDPFANATPKQRERMAEQRALIERERVKRPLAAAPTMEQAMEIAEHAHGLEPPREELGVSLNGSAGAALESGGFVGG